MEKSIQNVRDTRLELEDAIQENKKRLDLFQEEFASLDPEVRVSRSQMEKANSTVALEMFRHKLAILQGGPKASDCHGSFNSLGIHNLNNLARIWQANSVIELQELLIQEKQSQNAIRETINRKKEILNENKKLLEVLVKEKENIENRKEELEIQKISELEDKLAKVKRLYGEMKIHLKTTVETYFPDPKVPGYTGIYSLLNELTQRLLNSERDAYIEVQNTIWPYYLETLEKNGIIERHPTDHLKIRIIDFSDGRLGS